MAAGGINAESGPDPDPGMQPIVEAAHAKVNLTLEVLGRLPSGYHALRSLVAFADVGDRLMVRASSLEADTPVAVVETTGPFARDLCGPNLVDRARQLLAEAARGLVLPTVTLEKNLPVAAGIGGGSADAAAYLRLVRRLNPEMVAAVDWPAIGLRLGADVPVCLLGETVLMSGVGDRLQPVVLPRRLPALLVNPRCPVPATKTADVFRRLSAPAIPELSEPSAMVSGSEISRAILAGRNDLTAAAIACMPEIGDVMDRLHGLTGVQAVRLSGAGPTVLALFASSSEASAGARVLAAGRPNWWVAATLLG